MLHSVNLDVSATSNIELRKLLVEEPSPENNVSLPIVSCHEVWRDSYYEISEKEVAAYLSRLIVSKRQTRQLTKSPGRKKLTRDPSKRLLVIREVSHEQSKP